MTLHSITDHDDERPTPVDPPADPPEVNGRERPETPAVLPDWARSRAAVVDRAKWATRHSVHVTAFHALRLPLYWLRLVANAPRGLWRIVRGLVKWAKDEPGSNLVEIVIRNEGKTGDGLSTRKDHRKVVGARTTWLLLLVAGLGLAIYLVPWSTLLVVVNVIAALTVLGIVGKPVDRRVTSRSVDTEKVPKLTADLILTALGSLGIAQLNKELRAGTDGVRFPNPITRDGPGWRADIDLPAGVTAGDVIEARARLASGLRRPVGCVWPEGDSEIHAGRLILWVGDKPMGKGKPIAWTLAKAGKVSLFDGFPIGVEPRGKPVTVVLMFASMVIGALPRLGKTFTLRLLLLGAALDPTAEIHAYDLKGGADLLPLEPVAHRFRIGDDDDDIDYLVDDLRRLARDDLPRRYRQLRGLSREVCPEGKITPELAAHRDYGLYPIVLALDECQRAYEHSVHGAEIQEHVTDLVKRGPAAGIIVICATQRPDAKSLPPNIRANAVLRFCLKVSGQVENDMVLGTSAYKNGIRATMFSRTDQGIGFLAGEGDEPIITRTAYVDGPTAEAIAKRARAARIAAGLLTGHAAGVDPQGPQDEVQESILDHLATVCPIGEEQVWCEELAERLTVLYPHTYSGWSGEMVTKALKPYGIGTTQVAKWVDGKRRNKNGITWTALRAALRGVEPRADPPIDGTEP